VSDGEGVKNFLDKFTPHNGGIQDMHLGEFSRKYYLPARPLGFALFRFYFRLKVTGVEHIPPQSGGIIVPNHTSFLDPPLLSAVVPRVVYYLMLAKHYYHPAWHWLFSRLPCIPLNRGSVSHAEALKLCLQVLENGQLLCMFPEGGIAHQHKAGGAKLGAALLAARSQTPIIPVGICGAEMALPLHAKWPRPNPITIHIGVPLSVPPVETRDKDVLLDVTQTTMSRVQSLVTGGCYADVSI
jgi:1-acyl-sn-glycerol-3-phosphate acyltransferase